MGSSLARRFAAVCVLLLSWRRSIAYPTSSNESTPCEHSLSVEIPNAILHENGSAWDPDGRVLYAEGIHWISGDEGNETVRRGCPCNLHGRPCLRKCCPLGEVPTGGSECESLEHPFEFNVTDDGNDTYVVDGREHFALLFGNPCKNGRFLLDPDWGDSDKFWIWSTDGVMVTPNIDMKHHGAMNFCLDYIPSKKVHLPLVCVPPDAEKSEDDSGNPVYIIYPIFMLFSIVFLLITFLVYALIPELKNLHGKCLISHVSCLLVTYIFLAVVQLGAFIVEFSFLATFFWLNIMCFDICLTFSGMRPLPGSVREREKKKFLMYSLYAWGCPLIFLVVCLIMDLAPGIPDYHLKPRFGINKCWFDRKINALAYMYGPVAVLITCNIVMFIITAVKIVQLNRQTDVLRKAGSGTYDDSENRNRFNLYLKLLIVMGINWTMEVISWAVEGPDYLWYLTDIGNTLQGFFIFLIFVCKDKIRNIVFQKLCPKTAAKRPHVKSLSYRWRGTRGASPSKYSTSGGTASSVASSMHAIENVKLKPIGKTHTNSSEIEDGHKF